MVDLSAANVWPERTSDPRRALQLVEGDGAVIVTGVEATESGAAELGRVLFGERVAAIPQAALVREGGVGDRRPAGVDQHTRSRPHTDGYAYGDHYPDYFLLACERHCPSGGRSILLDGYAILDALAADPETAWASEGLRTVPIDQTEEGKRQSVSTVVQRAPSGRRMVRRSIDQRPAPGSDDPARDAAMIELWWQAIDAAADLLEPEQRPRVEAGEALVIDNYRMLHGREPYVDPRRTMWRLWVWTTDGVGVPEGLLHSDSRFAAAR